MSRDLGLKMLKSKRIAVIGLGYVGLPLATEFAYFFPVIGLDINKERIEQLNHCNDITREVEEHKIRSILLSISPFDKKTGLYFTSNCEEISTANIFIITVPTPID